MFLKKGMVLSLTAIMAISGFSSTFASADSIDSTDSTTITGYEKVFSEENNSSQNVNNESDLSADFSKIYENVKKDLNLEEELTDEQKANIQDLVSSQIEDFQKRHKEIENENSTINKLLISPLGIVQTDSKIVKYYQENLVEAGNVNKSFTHFLDTQGRVAAESYRLFAFYELVKSGGPWDLKRPLGAKTKYQFKGTQKTGEYIGNHHYGYMGRAIGFSTTVLKSAAGMYQIYSGTSKWSYISSYFDDPADQTAITNGATDYNNGYTFDYIIA